MAEVLYWQGIKDVNSSILVINKAFLEFHLTEVQHSDQFLQICDLQLVAIRSCLSTSTKNPLVALICYI